MGNTQKKPEVSNEEIEHARALWLGFTGLMKWGIIATVGLLTLLALVFFSG